MVQARKRFGQHFLHDRSVLDRIVRELAPGTDDALVEIGPGRGALTEKLVGLSRTLDAIEIDRDLAADLRARWGTQPGFHLHEADALDFDFAALAAQRATLPGGRLRIIQEGAIRKFVREVEQCCFNAGQARSRGRHVLYITERAVFESGPEGLVLKEIAPGIEIERDILPHMEFRPVIDEPKLMPGHVFE